MCLLRKKSIYTWQSVLFENKLVPLYRFESAKLVTNACLSLSLADKLDGLQHRPKHATQSMDEYLQLADEYFARQIREPGKKRVN